MDNKLFIEETNNGWVVMEEVTRKVVKEFEQLWEAEQFLENNNKEK